MIFCRKCGRYYSDSATSCAACGADLKSKGQTSFQGGAVQVGVISNMPSRTAAATAPARTPSVATAPARTPPVATAPARTPPVATAPARTPPVATAPARTPPVATAPDSDAGINPAFNRDRFLLRQKAIAIREKYYVTDETGMPLMFVERPALLAQQLLMLVGVAATFFGGTFIITFISGFFGPLLGVTGNSIFAFLGFIAVLVVTGFMFVLLVPKRHVTFYSDDSKMKKLLEIKQLNKVEFPFANFNIFDSAGSLVGRLRKNVLFDYIRRRWYVTAPSGLPLFVAKEDSIILSLLRRTGIPIFLFLRTNFIFLRGERVIGEFNRKLTVLDRYVLDMSADTQHTVDRRIALALGVMLDTGERR